jgi:SAM-dependent methyltransferase
VAKQYNRVYFDRWYREQGFGSRAVLERKVHYAVASCEYLIGRPIRSVLDVGCGEGAWQPMLRKLRPRASYLGIDPSHYVVQRFGARRNLRLGSVKDLDALDLGAPFDLIVCIDVLAYVDNADARSGIRSIGRLLGGVALVELFTSADDFEGDLESYHRRMPSTYERWFRDADLHRIGPNLFVGTALGSTFSHFERGQGAR